MTPIRTSAIQRGCATGRARKCTIGTFARRGLLTARIASAGPCATRRYVCCSLDFFFFLGSTSNADFISCRQEGRPTTLAQSPCAKANQGIRSAAVRAMNAVQTKMSSRSNPRWSLSVLLPPVKPPPRRPRRGIQGRRRTLRSAWVLESHWGSLR